MKRLVLGVMLLASVTIVPISAMAQVDINVTVGLPPPIVFEAPPEVIVLPDTNNVYVVPYLDVDMFFWNGWWWRPWEGRWYRSHYYNRGWVYYHQVPRFYYDVDPGWRGYYRDHSWHGHQWSYHRIPHGQLQRNWKGWHDNRYWERQRTWGVHGYQPRSPQQRQELRHERQQQYHQRSEVQQHQPQRQPEIQQPPRPPHDRVQPPNRPPHGGVQQPPRAPQVQEPRPPHGGVQQPPRHEQGPHGQVPQHSQSQGRPERGEAEHKR